MDWYFERGWSYLIQRLTNLGDVGDKTYYCQIEFREEYLVDFKRPQVYLTVFIKP